MECYVTWASQRILEMGKTDDSIEICNIITELKKIWKECFHDSDEYLNLFFSRRFSPQNTVIVICNNQIVGAGYLLPIEIESNSGVLPAVFGYALGVLKEYRGYGISGKIIKYMFYYCDENNIAFIMHPVNKQLAYYYERSGFSEVGYIKEAIFQFNNLQKGQNIFLDDIKTEDYTRLRNTHFMKKGYVKWDEAAINYAIIENSFCGGFCKKIIYNSKEYAVLGKVMGGTLTITEAVIPDSLLPEIVQYLAAYFETPEVAVFLPTGSKSVGMVIPWIMGYKVKTLHNAYCNLILN